MSDPTTTTLPPPTRDEIRTKIFGTKPRGILLEVFGTQIEMRQPSLGVILENQSSDDRVAATVNMLTQFAFVPGTNDLVFDDADAEVIAQLPFDENIQKLQNAISELTGAIVTDATKSQTPTEQSDVGGDDGVPRTEAVGD